MNTKSVFNFRMQQDKYSEVLKETDLKNKSINIMELHQNIVSPSFSVKENKFCINSNINTKVHSNEESKSIEKDDNIKSNNINSLHINFSNSAVKIMTDKHKSEISDLKSYILKLNSEIRSSGLITDNLISNSNSGKLYDYITELKEIEKYKTIFSSQNNELGKIYDSIMDDLINKLVETLKKLINPEYLNPIIDLFEKKISVYEKENKGLIKAKNDLEKSLHEYIEENAYLREENMYFKNENMVLTNGLVKGGDKNVIYTEEYVKQLEERLNLLSKENEIMGINYQKAVGEFFDYKMKFNNSYKEFISKNASYDKILLDNSEKNIIIEQISNKLLVTENKLFEVSDLLARHEMYKENCMAVNEKFQMEIKILNQQISKYKRQLGETDNRNELNNNLDENNNFNNRLNQISISNLKNEDRYKDEIHNNRNKTSIENVNFNRLSNTDFINMD
jgi:hypothetical protein